MTTTASPKPFLPARFPDSSWTLRLMARHQFVDRAPVQVRPVIDEREMLAYLPIPLGFVPALINLVKTSLENTKITFALTDEENELIHVSAILLQGIQSILSEEAISQDLTGVFDGGQLGEMTSQRALQCLVDGEVFAPLPLDLAFDLDTMIQQVETDLGETPATMSLAILDRDERRAVRRLLKRVIEAPGWGAAIVALTPGMHTNYSQSPPDQADQETQDSETTGLAARYAYSLE